MNLNFTCIDLETSGLDPAQDRIIEVCAMRVRDGEIVSVFNSMVFFDGDLSHTIATATGHTLEDTKRGVPEHIIAEVLWHMLRGDGGAYLETIIAYNAIFDMGFLHNLFLRNIPGYRDASETTEAFQWNFIDPLTILRDRKGYPHRLMHACQFYNIKMGQWHSAHDDVLALIEVVKKMDAQEDIADYINVLGYLRKYGEPTWYPEHATLKPQGAITVEHKPPKGASSMKSKLRRTAPKPDASKQTEPEEGLHPFTKGMLDSMLAGGSKHVGIHNNEMDAVYKYLTRLGIPEASIYVEADTPEESFVSVEQGYTIQAQQQAEGILTDEQIKALDLWIAYEPFVGQGSIPKFLYYHSQIAQLAAMDYLNKNGFTNYAHYKDNSPLIEMSGDVYVLSNKGISIDISDDDLPF